MKKLAVLVISSLCLASTSFGSVVAMDSAADSAYDAGLSTGLNGGFGFGAWQMTPLSSAGSFVGSSANNGGGTSSPNIDSAGRSWGFWANSGGASLGLRPITGASSGDITGLSFDMDNGWIEAGSSNSVARSVYGGLWNSDGIRGVGLKFRGGQSNYDFFMFDGISFTYVDSGIGFTDTGVNVVVSNVGASQWNVSVNRQSDSSSNSHTFNLAFDPGAFGAVNNDAGFDGQRDAFFNNLEVTAVPEPATMIMLGLGAVAALRRKSAKRA